MPARIASSVRVLAPPNEFGGGTPGGLDGLEGGGLSWVRACAASSGLFFCAGTQVARYCALSGLKAGSFVVVCESMVGMAEGGRLHAGKFEVSVGTAEVR